MTREIDRASLEMAVTIAELKDRIARLERASSLTNASIEDTAVQVYDDDGRFRGMIGVLPDGTAGMVEANGPVPERPTPPLVTTRNGMAVVLWHTASRVNYATDPSFESGTAGFTGNGGVLATLNGSHADRGSYSLGVRWEPGGTLTRSLADMPLTPGEFYTFAVNVDTTEQIEVRMSGDDDVAVAVGEGQRPYVTFRMGDTPPVVTITAPGAASGDQSWFDLWSVVPGTDAAAYFDGDDPGYQWVGDRYASPSVAVEAGPSDVLYVRVHADRDPGFIPTPGNHIGSVLPGGGPLIVPLPLGILHYIKVVVVTASGITSLPSDPTPVRVAPVQAADIGPGAVTGDAIGAGAIGESHIGFTFNYGAIVASYGPTPHADPRVDDMWWDSGNGYAPNRWDGDSWEPMEFGQAALSADSVTARQIMAGAVTAGAIAAGAVSTESLSVGAVAAGGSRVLNHLFEVPGDPDGFLHWDLDVTGVGGYGTGEPLKGAASAWVDLAAEGTIVRLSSRQPIAVRAGETWSVSVLVRGSRASATDQSVLITAHTSDDPDNLGDPEAVGTLWQTVAAGSIPLTDTVLSGRFEIPDGAKYLSISLRATLADPGGPISVGFDEVVLQPVIAGVQIANGAVRAEHVAADAIRTEHLEAGSVTGDVLAGQVVLASTVMTPEVDEAENPIPYASLTADGYEGRDAARRLRHRLSNTSQTSFYDGDAVLRTAHVRGPSTFDGPVEIGQGQTVRLASRTDAPGAPVDLSWEYATTRLNTVTMRGGSPPRMGGGGWVASRPFDPTLSTYATTRAHDNKLVVVNVWSDISRIWTFNENGSHYAYQDWAGWRITGYAYDGEHELVVGYVEAEKTWYIWDSYYQEATRIDPPGGGNDATIAVDYADTVPGGADLATGRKFYLLRRNADGVWRCRQFQKWSDGPGDPVGYRATASNVALPGYGSSGSLAGAAVGTFDYTDGVRRLVIGRRGKTSTVHSFNATTGEPTNLGADQWPAAVDSRMGLAWSNAGYFYDLSDDATLYRYSSNKWTTEGDKWWLAPTFANPTGPYETTLGVKREILMRRRADLRVGMPTLPDAPGETDPTRWRLYGTRRSSIDTITPPASEFDLIGEGVAPSVLLGSLPAGGAPPPTLNTFPGGKFGAGVESGTTLADGRSVFGLYGDGQQTIMPPSMIALWPGTTASLPRGFAFADGAIVPRTGDYARVFDRIGTRFGAGDGAATFQLPTIPNIAGPPQIRYVIRL